jgi:hypothetical protein
MLSYLLVHARKLTHHMWNSSSIRDSSVGILWIGSGAKENLAFMSARAREVSIVVDMVIDVQVRWG